MELNEEKRGLLRAAGVTEQELEAEVKALHDSGAPHDQLMIPVLRAMLRKEPNPELEVLGSERKTGLALKFSNGARLSFAFDGLSNPEMADAAGS